MTIDLDALRPITLPRTRPRSAIRPCNGETFGKIGKVRLAVEIDDQALGYERSGTAWSALDAAARQCAVNPSPTQSAFTFDKEHV
jgi:hypothetical protein